MPDELIYLSFLLLLVNVIALALPYQKAVPFPQKFGSVMERGHDIAVCSSEGKNGIFSISHMRVLVCFLTNWGGGGSTAWNSQASVADFILGVLWLFLLVRILSHPCASAGPACKRHHYSFGDLNS